MLLWTALKDQTKNCASRRVWRATPRSTTTTMGSLQKNTTENEGPLLSSSPQEAGFIGFMRSLRGRDQGKRKEEL
ncbi:unnamed protein product [Oncorhynchus mykiss]|uniref:Uncharacterized protein n=1 Tax=Oncorhynchus mykiss TaxID=8022 RepID=A0A060Y344_ONCMY|nr:unnamed protein product [Oncorhynchus mykiss]